MRRSDGNGHSEVKIQVNKKGEDYIIIAPDRLDNLDEKTPIAISKTVEDSLKDHPSVSVLAALPIVMQGDTSWARSAIASPKGIAFTAAFNTAMPIHLNSANGLTTGFSPAIKGGYCC